MKSLLEEGLEGAQFVSGIFQKQEIDIPQVIQELDAKIIEYSGNKDIFPKVQNHQLKVCLFVLWKVEVFPFRENYKISKQKKCY